MRGTHETTLEFTKETHLTTNGDCIIGVGADFGHEQLRELVSGKDSMTLTISVGPHTEVVHAESNKTFDDEEEIVVRTSDFISDRTLAIKADKAAIDLSRDMIELLKDPNTKGTVVIE